MTDLREVRGFADEVALDDALSIPRPELVKMMKGLDGDLMILGIAGKMGVTLGRMALKAIELAGVEKKVIGVSRFSDEAARKKLDDWGVETVKCDLLDQASVEKLPETRNIIYMAGKKFGTAGAESSTWAMNTVVPAYVADHFRKSRIVAFSTGCVYPLVGVETCGCTEAVTPAPVGEYSQSCLGRERIFEHFSKTNGTPTLMYRLNYAVDLRYGVLYDIASKIWADEPVSGAVRHFNIIWQGDANNYALMALSLCESPAVPLNVTGPETVALEHIAETFGQLMDKSVEYAGEAANSAYLNNAAKCHSLFGYPTVSLNQMIQWQAEWIMSGGRGLGKPTHFEVNDGKF